MNAEVSEGDMFWIPRSYPVCQIASHRGADGVLRLHNIIEEEPSTVPCRCKLSSKEDEGARALDSFWDERGAAFATRCS
uniref:Uncharacterized protein n=1 Tax=Musa acuminata subsp. malaccensis TaxID=214687 RepID=A0A804KAT6_MUSAM